MASWRVWLDYWGRAASLAFINLYLCVLNRYASQNGSTAAVRMLLQAGSEMAKPEACCSLMLTLVRQGRTSWPKMRMGLNGWSSSPNQWWDHGKVVGWWCLKQLNLHHWRTEGLLYSPSATGWHAPLALCSSVRFWRGCAPKKNICMVLVACQKFKSVFAKGNCQLDSEEFLC